MKHIKSPARSTAKLFASALVVLAGQAQAGGQLDLVLTMQGAASAEVSEEIQYYVNAHNQGPADARRAMIKITLPANQGVTSIPTECSDYSGSLWCNIGNLSAGQSYTLPFQMYGPGTPGNITTAANITSRNRDSNVRNNHSEVTTTITPVIPETIQLSGDTNLAFAECISNTPLTHFNQCPASSITNSRITLRADQTIDTNNATLSGNWLQPNPTQVAMNFYDINGNRVSTKAGTATSPTCFEGRSHYPLVSGFGAWRACIN